MAVTFVAVSGLLSRFVAEWLAWFIGGCCGVVPLWFSLPAERRVWWKAVLCGIGAGAAAAIVVLLLAKF